MGTEMKFLCFYCKKPCNGEVSTDPLLPPAIICEHCGSELELIPEKEPDLDAESKDKEFEK